MRQQDEGSSLQPMELRPPKEAWQVSWAKAQDQTSPDVAPVARDGGPRTEKAYQPAQLGSHSREIEPLSMTGPEPRHPPGTSQGPPPCARQPVAPWPLHVLRSSQLDAGRLDVELLALLREQLQKALSLFQPGRVADWEPELNALLRLLVFGLSVFRGNATPGSQLLNLRYRREPAFSPPQHASSTLQSHHHVASPSPPPISSLLPSQHKPPKPSDAVGRTGVEGLGLSLGQRLGLGFGMVVLPYLWSRAGSYLARASGAGAPLTWADLQSDAASTSSSSHDAGWQDGGLQAADDVDLSHEGAVDQSAGEQGGRRQLGGVLGLAYALLFRGPHQLARRLVAALLRLLRKSAAALGLSRGAQGAGRSGSSSWLSLPPHERLWKVMQVSEAVYRTATFANFLHFLAGGRYRSVLERLLGARLVYSQPVMTRIISFEYLNRQLVWQEVSELLLFVLPMLDALRTRNSLRRWLPQLPDPRRLLAFNRDTSDSAPEQTSGSHAGPGAMPAVKEGSEDGTGDVSTTPGASGARQRKKAAGLKGPLHRPKAACPVCGNDDMLLPVVAVPCGHCFCYYCLSSNTAATQHYECPCDGVRVAAMERWKPGYTLST